MNLGHAVIDVVVGLILLGLPLSIITTFSAIGSNGGQCFFYGWGGAAIIGGILGALAKRPAKIFRYIFLFGAVVILLLPLATCIGPTIALAKGGAAAAAGAAIGAGLGSMVIGFFAFFVAAAYLIVGLLIGRGKSVIAAPDISTPTQYARAAPRIAMQRVPDHYATLGVPHNASQQEVDAASKRSIDSVRDAMSARDPHANEIFVKLRVAMDTLRDPISRATYDTDLLAEQLRGDSA